MVIIHYKATRADGVHYRCLKPCRTTSRRNLPLTGCWRVLHSTSGLRSTLSWPMAKGSFMHLGDEAWADFSPSQQTGGIGASRRPWRSRLVNGFIQIPHWLVWRRGRSPSVSSRTSEPDREWLPCTRRKTPSRRRSSQSRSPPRGSCRRLAGFGRPRCRVFWKRHFWEHISDTGISKITPGYKG